MLTGQPSSLLAPIRYFQGTRVATINKMISWGFCYCCCLCCLLFICDLRAHLGDIVVSSFYIACRNLPPPFYKRENAVSRGVTIRKKQREKNVMVLLLNAIIQYLLLFPVQFLVITEIQFHSASLTFGMIIKDPSANNIPSL